MSFTPIAPSAVDAKSPIDEALMGLIKSNFDDLNGRANAVGAFDYQWKVNGFLNNLFPDGGSKISYSRRKRLDGCLISKPSTFQACRIFIEDGGAAADAYSTKETRRTLECDLMRVTLPDCEIQAVTALFRADLQSVSRVGTSLNTQSIARATSQLNTQSIARWKATLSIASIIDMGADNPGGIQYFKINLTSAPDADYVEQQVHVASTTGATNDGDFFVDRCMDDGGNNIVVQIATGAAQPGAGGTVELNLWKYTYTNPVSAHFAAGESVKMTSHTTSANNGTFSIYATNQGGNNIIVANTNGVAQAGVIGTADTNRFKYTLSAPASTTDYVVGETAVMASHTSGVNDGAFPIVAVNDASGNNIVVANLSGAVQGGAAGTIDTQRWILAYSSDPSGIVSAADNIWSTGTAAGRFDGQFTVKEVDHAAGTNLVVYNTNGAVQGGAAGTTSTTKKKVKFSAAQSNITTDSRLWLVNSPVIPENDYDVLAVNLGGGSNHNAIIETQTNVEQPGPSGRVAMELKSIFDTRPSITLPKVSFNWHGTHGQVSSNAVFNVARGTVPGDTFVFLDLTKIPDGAKNLTVQLL